MTDKDVNPFAEDVNPFAPVESYNPFESTHYDEEPSVPLDNNNNNNTELKFREPDYNDAFYGQGNDTGVDKEEKINLVPPPPPGNDNKDSNSRTTSVRGSRVTIQDGEPEDKDQKSFWELEFYQQFFNISSKEVGMRCLRSMWPFKYDFIQIIKTNPDFYGPFWISTTLIFMMAASANFSSYLDNSQTWHYDFFKLSIGSGVIYSFAFIVPVLFWLYMRWIEYKMTLIEILCIYGYSLFIYSPVSVLCVIPVIWAKWVAVGIGCLLSTSFLIINLWMPLREKLAHAFIILAIMTALHVGLALIFRLYFFDYVSSPTK